MIIDNRHVTLKDVFQQQVSRADEVLICSPFLGANETLFSLLESKLKLTVICRLVHPATPDLFYRILPWLGTNKRFYVYDDSSLHAKIYLFKKNNRPISAIVGSSNFTINGLSTNKEVNILFKTSLQSINKYFAFLIDNSFEDLTKSVIQYYSKFYRKPDIPLRYRRARISQKRVQEYSSVLDKFAVAKGILQYKNSTRLPFTYLFDLFCHYFKVNITNDYSLESPFRRFNQSLLKRYFDIFLRDYLDKDEISKRLQRLKLCSHIAKHLSKSTRGDILDFYLGIHSVTSGSGKGNRINIIKETDTKTLKDLLSLFLNEDLSMPEKYSLALTSRAQYGRKVEQLGPSAIGEIPGWLIPNKYPIKNGKFIFVMDFFNI